MIFRTSARVTYKDLVEYFKDPQYVLKKSEKEDYLRVTNKYYTLEFEMLPQEYEVYVYANDDHSDSEKGSTKDPLGFIKKFLKTEDFKFASVSPKRVAEFIHFSSLKPDVRGLRRLRVAILLKDAVAEIFDKRLQEKRVVASVNDEMISEFKKKGWDVDQDGKKTTVSISDEFTAEITKSNPKWWYSLEVTGEPDTKMEGETDDPIQKYRGFFGQDSIQELKKEIRKKRDLEKESEEIGNSKTELPREHVDPTGKTIPAEDVGKTKPSAREEETVKPKKREPSREEETVKPGKK